jgi:outer membrane lipoprotein-sorting protein
MKQSAVLVLAASLATHAVAVAADTEPPPTADRIIERNVAARGGLEAWHKVRSMVWVGHIETAVGTGPRYILEMKRPDKRRFEIKAPGLTGVRIFDGSQGWKLSQGRDSYPDVQPYSAEEASFARDDQGIGGPLIDYREKGIGVALEGVEAVEGRNAYRLKLTLPSGAGQRLWIDAESFLVLKEARESRNALGMAGTLTVFYRDYRTVDGLRLPFLIESGVGSGNPPDRMIVDRVALDVPLGDELFAKPFVPHRHAIYIGGQSPEAGLPPALRGPLMRNGPDAAAKTGSGHAPY